MHPTNPISAALFCVFMLDLLLVFGLTTLLTVLPVKVLFRPGEFCLILNFYFASAGLLIGPISVQLLLLVAENMAQSCVLNAPDQELYSADPVGRS